jgi:hypothetical protein
MDAVMAELPTRARMIEQFEDERLSFHLGVAHLEKHLQGKKSLKVLYTK